MKREKFLREVAEMCGPAETAAVHRLAQLPRNQRRAALGTLAGPYAERGLSDFLTVLIDDDLIEDLAAILAESGAPDEAQRLLSELWARLVGMIGPQARDVLYAHNQLRLMLEARAQEPPSDHLASADRPYQSALHNARAVLAATAGTRGENAKAGGD